MKHLLKLSLVVILLSACAAPMTVGPQGSRLEVRAEAEKQKEYTRRLMVKTFYEDARRLDRITYPILKNNVALCGRRTVYDNGIRVWSAFSWPQEFYYTVHKMHGLDRGVSVYMTVNGSPADKAGIRTGDKILAVNGEEIFEGKDVLERYKNALKKQHGKAVTFTVERQGVKLKYIVKPHKKCNFDVLYAMADKSINAYADGKNIYATKGMMDFAKDDLELALVMSHELGHNIMNHTDKKKSNAMIGGLLGLAIDLAAASSGVHTNAAGNLSRIGANSYSVEFEQEADYVGLYIMKRAGYEIDNVENLWRRFGAEVNSQGISIRTTHPAHAERYVAINKTIKEIKTKQRKGKAIMPNLAEDPNKKGHFIFKSDGAASFNNLN